MSGSKSRLAIKTALSLTLLFVIAWSSGCGAQGIFDEMLGRYSLVYDSTYIWPDGKGGYDYVRKFISEVILDEQGRSVLSRPATPILGKNDRITINAYTRLGSGEILAADTTDMVTRSLSGDRRWIFVNFRQAEPGAALHFEWTLSSKEANIAGKRFLGRTVPVERAVVILTAPETWVFNFALGPGTPAEQTRMTVPQSSGPAKVNYHWISNNLAGLTKEEFAPPIERMIPCLYFSLSHDSAWKGPEAGQVDWPYLSRLYYQQLKTFVKNGSDINSAADSISRLTLDKAEMASMAYTWLGAHFRPFESEITLSGSVNDALHRGRGTQAEAAGILLALFERLEIPSAPYLIATRDAGEPLAYLPALFWFDRLLIAMYAEEDTVWIDPNYQSIQIGIVPFEDQGARALDISRTGAFTRVPMPDYHENGKAIHLRLDFDSTGSLEGDATEIYSGAMIPEISSYLQSMGEEELKTPWEKKLAKSFPNARINRFVVIPPDSAGQPFKVGYLFSTGPLVRPFADRAYIPMDLLGRWADLPALPNKTRQFPIELHRPRFELERITLRISPPFEVDFIPSNYSDNNEIGEIYSVAKGVGTSVTITRGFGLKKASLPASEYGSLSKFFGRARTEADKTIILKRVG